MWFPDQTPDKTSLTNPSQLKTMWLLIVALYAAPPDAVNWKGSWELGMTKLVEHHFESEAGCLKRGIDIKAKLNEGMLAPVRFHCFKIESGLPTGTAR